MASIDPFFKIAALISGDRNFTTRNGKKEEKYEWERFNLIGEAEDRDIKIGEDRGIKIGRKDERRKADTEKRAEREAAISALRAKGVSEDIIKEVYGDTNHSSVY